jgi:hypothetical protein
MIIPSSIDTPMLFTSSLKNYHKLVIAFLQPHPALRRSARRQFVRVVTGHTGLSGRCCPAFVDVVFIMWALLLSRKF